MTNKMKKVSDLVDKWKPLLELEHWDISIERLKDDQTAPHGMVAAEIDVNTMYQHATLTVFPYLFRDDDEIEITIVHELCHCLTQNYKDLFGKYVFKDKVVTIDQEHEVNERITNQMSRLAMRLSKKL